VIGAVTVRNGSVTITDAAIGGIHTTARVQRLCDPTERAISAGTSWSDDDPNLRLFTAEVEPLFNTQNPTQVQGFAAVGGNDSGQSSTFRIHVLCYTP
jgi:hypothetical protein